LDKPDDLVADFLGDTPLSRNALLAATMLAATAAPAPAPALAQSSPIQKPAAQKIDGLINWVYDYEQGRRLAKQTGRPMFVVFRCER
jgi:hypothetical protein